MKMVDFLPESLRVQRRRRANLIRQGHLLVLCVAGLAVLGYMRQGRVSRAEAELVQLQDRSTNVAGQLAMRSSLETQLAELMMKQRIDEHLGSRISALDIMGELQTVMSDRLTLTDMQFEALDVRMVVQRVASNVRVNPANAGKPDPASTVTRRVRLTIAGMAPTDIDVATFIGQLATSPLFENIKMGYSRGAEYDNRKVREFQVTCFVVR